MGTSDQACLTPGCSEIVLMTSFLKMVWRSSKIATSADQARYKRPIWLSTGTWNLMWVLFVVFHRMQTCTKGLAAIYQKITVLWMFSMIHCQLVKGHRNTCMHMHSLLRIRKAKASCGKAYEGPPDHDYSDQ